MKYSYTIQSHISHNNAYYSLRHEYTDGEHKIILQKDGGKIATYHFRSKDLAKEMRNNLIRQIKIGKI